MLRAGLLVLVALLAAPAGLRANQAASEKPGTRTLYLVRHGFYDYHDERDPDIGKALVPLGVAQARLVGGRLRSLPVRFSALYSSTMTRARETAYVIREEIGLPTVVESNLLSECTPPTWREDITAHLTYPELLACRDQLDDAFRKYFVPSPGEPSHEIVVCHGNVIRYFVTRTLRVNPLSWLGMSIGNCSLTIVRINPDGTMKLLSFGDVGHLPPNLQTGLDDQERVLTVPEH